MVEQEPDLALTIAGEELEAAYLAGDPELIGKALEKLHTAQRVVISSLSEEQRADLRARIKEWEKTQ